MKPFPIKDVPCKYGAPMGRRSSLHPGNDSPIKLHLRYVPFVDGCYDQGGAYWGSPANLYVAWGHDLNYPDEPLVEFYCRASSREGAKAEVLAHRPNARFYR